MSFGIRKKVLKGDELWEHYYVTMGTARSLARLAEWATNRYGVNPITHRPWTKGAVQQSMWFHCFKECWKDGGKLRKEYSDASAIYRDYKPISDEEWFSDLARRSHSYYTPRQYKLYIRKHPELQLYEIV